MDKSRQNFEYIKSSKKTRYTHYLSEAAHSFVRNNKYIIELLAEGSYTAKPSAETTAPLNYSAPVKKPSFSQPSYSKPVRDDELIPADDPYAADKLAAQEALQPYEDSASAEAKATVDRIMKEARDNAN